MFADIYVLSKNFFNVHVHMYDVLHVISDICNIYIVFYIFVP